MQQNMKQDMTTFDELWEREERVGLQQRLQRDYPAWQQRQKRRMTAVTAVLACVLLSPFVFHPSASDDARFYDAVCCNRSGIPAGHWADVASNILTIETL